MAIEIRRKTNMKRLPINCAGCGYSGDGERSIARGWLWVECGMTGTVSDREQIYAPKRPENCPLAEVTE